MPINRQELRVLAGRDRHNAASCRWSTPTLFLAEPFWLVAEQCPWTCTREPVPRAMGATKGCTTCTYWAPRPIQ